MSIKHDIRAFMLNTTTVTVVCSTRIYANTRPQNDPLPALVISYVGDDPAHYLTSAAPHDCVTLQMDCMGSIEEDADSLADAVRSAFDGLGAGTVTIGPGASQIGSVTRGNRIDLQDPDPAGRDQYVHRACVDYEILYGLSVPSPTT